MPSKDVEMADVAEPAAELEQRDKGGSKEHKHRSKDKDRSKDHKHKSHKSSHKSKDKDRDREQDRSRHPSSERDRKRRRGDASPQPAQPRAAREESPLEGDVPVPMPSDDGAAAGAAAPDAAAAAAAAPDVQPAAEQNGVAGAAEPARQSGEGGEVSMSIEETNKMRVAMGLKPLKVEGGTTEEREAKERAAGKARADAARKKVEERELRERIEMAKAKRKMEADLAKVKGLGEAKPEVDDVAAWVSRSREAEQEAKRQAEREKAAKMASMYDEEDEDESDEEAAAGGGGGQSAAELEGVRVAHSAEGLGAGETVILTLKDRNILEEGDDDPEELEDVLATQQRKREKARKEAVKPAVEYDEDGHAKGMLSKYDEEEADAGFQIRAGAVVADDKARKAAEVRRKLTEGSESLAAGGPASFQSKADFYTEEEAAAFAKPKKRLKKKLRKKAAVDEEEAVPSDTTAAVAALEEAAAAQAAAGGAAAGDHGSRSGRGSTRDADKAAAEAAEAKRRRDRYDTALQKANYATLAASMAPDASASGGAEEEDDEVRAALEASMRRSRSAAPQRRDADAVASEVVKRRQEEEAQPAAPAAEAGERLTEATEFARLVGQRDEGTADGADDDAGGHMGVDAPDAAPAVGSKRKYRATKADEDEAGPSSAGGDGQLPPPPAGGPPVKVEDSVTRERNIGKGVAGVLGLLKERGELNGKGSLRAVEWAGRTNDMKPVALQGLEEVYTGGRSANALENSVERALTRRDAHGRVLTPKEAFRDLCHHFHGIFPSKSNQERQMEKDVETAAAKRAATSENPASLRRLQAAQKQAAAPYVVLSGSVRPGQTSDPTSGFATATGYQSAAAGGASVAPTPVLGGGKTPLVGDSKVKAMLGIKREGGASMPPPPSRQRKG